MHGSRRCARLNSYGLFAVMTTDRREIIVEGSNDGMNWLPYEFKYKPGDVNRRPAFVAPHQPRLDWQMWFAALGDYRQNPWFVNFCERLLQGSPEVLALLDEKSVSRPSAALHSRRTLRLPFHQLRRTPRHGPSPRMRSFVQRCLVEARIHLVNTCRRFRFRNKLP